MTLRWLAAGAMAMLAFSSGGALAQISDDQDSFYSEPVMPDPTLQRQDVLSPALATADVAAATQASASAKTSSNQARTPRVACTAINPCAVVSPARS